MSSYTTSDAPPPGWYPDPNGTMRWWDGQAWTAGVARPPGATGNTKTMAFVAHLSGIVGGWILALVIYLVDGGKDRFVHHHASEALNFQLSILIVTLADYALFGGSLLLGVVFFPFLLVTVLAGIAFFVIIIGHITYSIIGMVRANRGEWWVYPFNIRMVKGRCPPDQQYPVAF